MPGSRLGESFLFRKRVAQAAKVLQKQDEWCTKANSNYQNHPGKINRAIAEPFPESIEEDLLVDLLRGKVLLNAHCYEVKRLN